MQTRSVLPLVVCLLAFLALGEGTSAVGAPRQPEALTRGSIQAALLQAPLTFEVNRGQTAAQVRYLSRGPGHTLFLTSDEAVLALRRDQQTARDSKTPQLGTVLRMRLVGANPDPRVEPLELLPGTVNYFIGNDRTTWRTDIPIYAKVKYQAVYPGVDLIYHGTNQRQLEYDFVVAPGANPKAIRLAFAGVERLSLDRQGNLILHTTGGEVVQRAPKVYQEIDGVRQAIAGRYVLYGKHQVGFRVAGYNRARPLVIDPVLSYSTYLGGSGEDAGRGIAVDKFSGIVYVVGSTTATDFPTTAGPGYGGGPHDVVVAKLDPTLAGAASLLYSTYLGGRDDDQGAGIAIDMAGNAYVTGTTLSFDFPATAGVYQAALAGGLDAFVAKLNPAGALFYATYLGGSDADEGLGIAVDSSGQAYVTGRTRSSNLLPPSPPFTPFQATIGSAAIFDAFVAKLNPAGSALVYATYLGGSGSDDGRGIAVDSSGNAYVTGLTKSASDFPRTAGVFQGTYGGGTNDVFVAKLDPTLAGVASLVYSTFLGGSGNDQGFAIAVDSSGNAYVTGSTTSSSNFPLANALQPTFGGGTDAFVTKLNPAGTALVYSTFLGGSGSDQGGGIVVDAAGNAYVTGVTGSSNFPTVSPLTQDSANGVNVGTGNDAFVTELNPAGAALVYSTFLGGSGFDQGFGIAVDSSGNVYVTGTTTSDSATLGGFPTTSGAYQTVYRGGNFVIGDAFVVKLGASAFSVTVTVAGTGTGTVTSSPAGITCPGACSATFTSGTSVTLTAAPTGGATFAWGGDCAASGTALTCTLTMDVSKAVTATFSAAPVPLVVSVAGTGTGTVTSSPAGITCPGVCSATFTSGTSVTLTAAPTGGATLIWGGDCAASGTALTCTLTMDVSKAVTATFSTVSGDGAACNMVGHVHGNQNYKATVSGKKINVHVEVDGDCDYDKKANKVFLHHAMVHVVVDGGPPLINAKQNSNGKRDDVKSVTLSPGPPPATGTPTAVVEGIYNAIPFKVTLTDGCKKDKDDDHDKWGKRSDDKLGKRSDDKWDKDDGDCKKDKDDTVVVATPVLPAPITGSAPHDTVHIDFK